MQLRNVLCLNVVAILFGATLTVQADVPQLINYQGVLLDSGGDPVPGPVDVTFTIYDNPTTGESKWAESRSVSPDAAGRFSIILGEVNPLVDTVFREPIRWLGLQVSGDPEMTPRARIVSAGYACRTSTVDGATGGIISGALTLPGDGGDTLILDPLQIVIRGAGGDEQSVYAASGMTYSGTGNALTAYDSDGDVRVTISVDEDGGGITLFESSATQLPGQPNQGGRKVEFREGGVLLYGASDADTVCHLLPDGSIIGRGQLTMGPNSTAGGDWATVLGYNNSADGDSATVSGGFGNSASGYASTISGGARNDADSAYCTIGGGAGNTANGTLYGAATVSGGVVNQATGDYSTVGGGYSNTASGDRASVSGGSFSQATGDYSFVGSGYENIASGYLSTCPGGYRCTASGEHSFAVGCWATAGPANNTMVLGTGSNNINRLVNNTANSLIVGFNKTSATLFVGGSNHRVGVLTTSPSYPLDVNGDIGCVTLHESSDERLKTNINQLDGVLDKLEKIRGVSFEWNETAAAVGGIPGQKQIGVLAQEVEMFFPELVSEREDGFKSVNYTKLTAVLVEAIKDLKAENDELQDSMKDIDELQQELANVKAMLQKILPEQP